MIGTIVWLIGVFLTIKAALEVWKISAGAGGKILVIVLLLLTSWLGLALYYFFLRDKLAGWLK